MILLILSNLIFLNSELFSQEYQPILPPEHIKTVQLFNPQSNDLNPIIEMGTEYLILSFDDLNGGNKNYSYQIEYKNPDWSEANIFSSEYLNGYTTGYIRDFTTAFNTIQNYTHYRVKIPNNNMIPTLSGNYELKVFEPGNKKPIFTKRFAVFEPLVEMFSNVERFLGKGVFNQRIITEVRSNTMDLTQNPNGAKLVIMKNNNWEDVITAEHPQFSQPNLFTYNQNELIFEGGYEHYWFDTKNIESPALTTEKLRKDKDNVIHTYLYLDEVVETNYYNNPDINGAFFIRNTQLYNDLNANSEADYTWVYFGLENFNDSNGQKEVYVVGGFNDWVLSPENKLKKNESGYYETSLFLKQGYYNYTYAIVDKKTKSLTYWGTTGSFWQTENYYQSLFYYQPWGERYSRLIGVSEAYSQPSLR